MPHHLTLAEREIIAQMRYAEESQSEIARRLHRDRSTISQELKRNSSSRGYSAVAAQHAALLAALEKGDAPRAERAMKDHLLYLRDLLRIVQDGQPG